MNKLKVIIKAQATLSVALLSLQLLGAVFAYAEISTGTVSGTLKNLWLEKGHEMVVYVEKADGAPFPQPEVRPVMNQINLVYVPHVLPIVAGWEVEFQSEDKVLHNLLARFKAWLQKKAPSKKKKSKSRKRRRSKTLFNLAMPSKSKPIVKSFKKTGIVTLLCSIHPEMSAYIVVLQNPYFDKVGKKGVFEIEAIPAGKYNLKVWGKKLKKKQLAKTYPFVVTAGKTTELSIQP